MKLGLLTFVSLIFPCLIFSQYTVSGKVLDKNDVGISYANVLLLKQKDSTVVDARISEEKGYFIFEAVPPDYYFLKVSFVGYKSSFQKFNLAKDMVLPKIVLLPETENLDEVTLTTKLPKIRRAADRIIFDIENTSISSGSTWDALKMAPGVIIIQDELKIRNTTASIYINEKKVNLTSSELKQLLASFSAENVKQIEILRNPSAKYDAGDGAIINIMTTKMLVPGYKANINTNYTQGIYAKYNIGSSHYYKNDKFHILFNYNYAPAKRLKQDKSYVNFIRNDEVFNRWRTNFNKVTRENSHQSNIIIDFDLNEKQKISLNANGIYSPRKRSQINAKSNAYSTKFKLDSIFTTNSKLTNNLTNIGYDLGYIYQYNKNTKLALNLHSTYYDNDVDQFIFTDYYTNQNQLLDEHNLASQSSQKINIYAGQLDFETTLGAYQFLSGLKHSNINSSSSTYFYELESDVAAIANTNLLNVFHYDEAIYAGYISLTRAWQKLTAKVGLRVEHTNRIGKSLGLNLSNSRKYTEPFPSLNVGYQLSENHNFSFNYGRKINRPKYESLNPFIYFITENSFQTGNSNLRASISNEFNLNYTFKDKYSFDFYYRDNGKNMASIIFQNNDYLYLRNRKVNVLASKSYGIDFFHGRSIKPWWYAQAILSGFHEEETFLAEESNMVHVTNKVRGFYASIYNSLTLSKEKALTGHVNFLYISDFILGSYQVGDQLNLSFGIRKKIWKERAEFSLFVADLFNEYSTKLTSTYLNQDNGFYALPENRFIRFGFKYNFGNIGLKENNRSMDAEERERL
ncbi:outer membrane beta-barrel family protein [Mesonia aestuariivivens]|uniref:TonB-dependent receptor family protein n=1 Tax=Mesonia aestuariivivens TaxID=2796128 RepID=A0ABS6W148_9FLAO|nr:outer membrane beta-barrel family protein [Mesonia aestuariivivens]MBW2961583.1 TonB-dependent receptor family protein [Mesonia aestuariivivens]